MAKFQVYADAVLFRDVIAELVARDPVGATMLAGIVDGHIADPAPGDRPLLACLTDVDGPAVAVLAFAGYPLQLLVDPELRDVPAALGALVDGLVGTGATVTGFNGRREPVRALAAAWHDRTGADPAPRMWTLYYRLRQLIEPVGVGGAARELNPDDPAQVALAAAWLTAFERETGVARPGRNPDAEFVRRSLRRGMVFTWWCLDSGPVAAPVALAGHSPLRADGGIRIAPVYTAPDRRRQRFAAAATAAAVRSAHRLGAAEVTLFTDEDYLPSNELYRSLGFEPIAEFAEFDLPGG